MLSKKLRLALESTIDSKKSSDTKDGDQKNENEGEDHIITSKYFQNKKTFWQKLYKIECNLNDALSELKFVEPVTAVYNPVVYAADLHCAYLRKFAKGPIPVLFIGMNPGPWGMCQTGVPFGYIPAVRDWMKLEGNVEKPYQELTSRPVTGLQCEKAEQSGQRFWGLFENICGANADVFFANCFVYNYCPLAFFYKTGRNITPAELKGDIKLKLQELCCESTQAAIELFQPDIIISIGRYAEDRVKSILKSFNHERKINHLCMPHPSPRSLNNTDWNGKAKIWLTENDIMKYITK